MDIWGGRIDIAAIAEIEGFVSPERQAIERFTAWASEHGYTLQPAFETHEIGSLITEETREVIIPPMICLAVYDGSDLQAVFPYSDGEAVHTVNECLDRLEMDADQFTAETQEVEAE